MNGRRIRIDPPPDVGVHLARGATQAKLAAILGRWTDLRRPAVLFVLVGEAPFAEVFSEHELLALFPDAPVIHAEPIDRGGDLIGSAKRIVHHFADTEPDCYLNSNALSLPRQRRRNQLRSRYRYRLIWPCDPPRADGGRPSC